MKTLRRKVSSITLAAALLSLAMTGLAAEDDEDNEDGSGLEAEFVLDNEFFVALQDEDGDQSTVSSEIELELGVDFEELFGWSGWEAGFIAKANRGDAVASASGETLPFSGAADDRGEELEELWIQKNFASGRAQLLVGKLAAENDFDVRETADVFVNGGFEEGPELAELGEDGGAVVPLPGLGARLNLALAEDWVFRVAVVEGEIEEADPDLPADAGYFYITELDWSPFSSSEARLGLGAWHHTGDFQRLIGEADEEEAGQPFKSGTSGYYLFAEGPLYESPNDPDLVISAFARIGFADDEVAAFDSHQSVGLVVSGLIPGRTDDLLGFGVTSITNGSDYRRASRLEGDAISGRETAIELTYLVQATDWLIVQPTLQCAINRDGDPDEDRACAAGLGLTLEF